MQDLIIIGGGPAGLAATLFAVRKRLNTLHISQDLGGKTNYTFKLPYVEPDHHKIGGELVDRLWTELDKFNAPRRLTAVDKVEKEADHFQVITESGETYQTQAVILATGSHIQQLGVPGEADYVGRGLSYSALSYASFMAGKDVAVIGDARLALRAVADLSLFAAKVHLIVPLPTYDVMDTPLLQQLQSRAEVIIWEGYRVVEIAGAEFANRIIIEKPDGEGTGVDVDGIFIEVGLSPNSAPVGELVDLDNAGFVIVDNLQQTSCTGLFAAGDVTNADAEQVFIAVGQGVRAALSAFDYLLPRSLSGETGAE